MPNGLRLITIPTDFPTIVSLYIVVGTGSRNEVLEEDKIVQKWPLQLRREDVAVAPVDQVFEK